MKQLHQLLHPQGRQANVGMQKTVSVNIESVKGSFSIGQSQQPGEGQTDRARVASGYLRSETTKYKSPGPLENNQLTQNTSALAQRRETMQSEPFNRADTLRSQEHPRAPSNSEMP